MVLLVLLAYITGGIYFEPDADVFAHEVVAMVDADLLSVQSEETSVLRLGDRFCPDEGTPALQLGDTCCTEIEMHRPVSIIIADTDSTKSGTINILFSLVLVIFISFKTLKWKLISSLLSIFCLSGIANAYFLGDVNVNSFQDAQDYCKQKDSSLASIHNAEDLQKANDLCAPVSRCWLGIYQESDGKPWKNIDGTAIHYGFDINGAAISGVKPWNPNEPNRADEHCVQLEGNGYADYPCNYSDTRPLCNSDICTITACNEWDYGSISNSMQMKIIGSLSSSSFFYVNKYSKLPINGETSTFDIPGQNYGDLYSIQIFVDDPYGFCIQSLEVNVSEKTYVFNGDKYFGSGIILAPECKYSHQFISNNLPLITCNPGILDLNANQSRGIYSVDIHSCIGDGTGISAKNMKDNVYAVIMGKKSGENAYTTTSPIYLDHYVPGNANLENLGHLIAGNAVLVGTATNALYSRDIVGTKTMIGIKLEIVDYKSNTFADASTVNIKVDGSVLDIYKKSSFGRYLILFLKDANRKQITKTTEIYVYSAGFNNIAMNIYAIFTGDEEFYSLSFKVIDSVNNINWFDANEKCKTDVGTTLTSIHSQKENFLIQGFLGEKNAWIGLFDLTLESQNNWKWTDGSKRDYSNWSPGEPNNYKGEDCVHIDANRADGEWNDRDCVNLSPISIHKFVCSSPQWTPSTNRIFEINTVENIKNITLISIGNNNKNDNLCIDSISVQNGKNDKKSAVYISSNIIGGDSDASSLNAIFNYPVCKTEVVGMRIDYDSSTASVLEGDATIAGLECSNNNRLLSSTCSISQSYELTKSTSVSISKEDSTTKEYSWGSASSLTIGTSSSTTTSDEFSFGFDQSVSIGTESEVGVPFIGKAKLSTKLSLGSNQQWTETTEKTKENSKESTTETNNQNTNSQTNTNGEESSWETSSTTTIECSAEIDIPPSHSVNYALIFNAYNTTIQTYTDLKLTLCSALMHPSRTADESNYVYIDNIPGFIRHKETTSCNVEFSPAKYIRNDVLCIDEQRLAFASGSNYIPRCNSGNTSLYDGCQCDIGDSKTLGQCFCVDQQGNMLDNTLMYVPDGVQFEKICVQDLQCANSEITYTAPVSAHEQSFKLQEAISSQLSQLSQLPESTTLPQQMPTLYLLLIDRKSVV